MSLRDIRDKMVSFYYEHKRMPSYSEIARLAGFKSKNAAYKAAESLLTDGFIRRDITGRLLPGSFFGGVRLLGLVEAGFPSPAEEELSDTMNLDDYLIDNREATFMLTVKGDSMIEAGINEGDMVLVERNNNAKPGDIVVAEVDGDWTMKYYRIKRGRTVLEPANRKYKDIIPGTDLKISAVVKAVIRKY